MYGDDGIAGLDTAVASIGWANQKMGERYAYLTDGQRARLQERMARVEGEELALES